MPVATMGLLWNPRRYKSQDWGRRRERALSCVPAGAFRGATGPRPPGWGGGQPPANQCKYRNMQGVQKVLGHLDMF